MLILATGHLNSSAQMRRTQRGVTLVELLVVVAIIAMIASVVVLNAPPPRSNVDRATEKFAAQINHAVSEAITSGAMIGLEVTDRDYRFLIYDRGEWRPTTIQALRPRSFPEDISVEIVTNDKSKKNEPDEPRDSEEDKPRPVIRFTPTGEATPFIATFKTRQTKASIHMDAAGVIALGQGGADAE